MKVFEKVEGFENKVNFVDENNIFVGFILERECCEEWKYFFVKQLPEKVDCIDTDVLREKEELKLTDKQLDPYIFDTSVIYYSSSCYSDRINNSLKHKREGIKLIKVQYNIKEKEFEEDRYDYYIIFKLVNKNDNKDNIFLFLCNCHNCFYAHDVFFGRKKENKEEVILSFEI